MIEDNVKQSERLIKLNCIAKKELDVLINDKNVIGINKLDNKKNNLISNE